MYQSGTKKMFKINTPNLKRGIKKLTRGSYKSRATMMLSTPGSYKCIVLVLECKILCEMHIVRTNLFLQVLLKLKNFSLDKVMIETIKSSKTPFLASLPHAKCYNQNSFCVFFILSLLLKCRHNG